MSLEIAYAAMGGDLETVRGRLLTDERIEKFREDLFAGHIDGKTFGKRLFEAGDLPEAYRGAHTLKGCEPRFGLHAAVRSRRRPVRCAAFG